MKYVQTLMDEREALAAQILGMAEKATAEERSLTDSENASIDTMQARIGSLDTELTRWADTTASFRSFSDLSKRIVDTREEKQETEQRAAAPSTPGMEFTASDAYRDYQFRGASGRLEVCGMLEQRALHTNTALGLGNKTQYMVDNPPIATPILDAIGFVPISTNSVEYVKWVFTNAAAVVAEGTVKPESTFSRTLVPKTVPTVAHWTELSRQLAEDEVAIANLINSDMRDGVLSKIEDLAAAAIAAATFPTVEGVDLLSSIRLGLAAVPRGYTANAVLLNPADWAELDITVMSGTLVGPNVQQGFWGLTPIASPDVAAGTAIVGDFKRCVKRFNRSEVALYMTDSDVDGTGQSNFKRNILTLLAEARALVDVVDERGLVECTLAPVVP